MAMQGHVQYRGELNMLHLSFNAENKGCTPHKGEKEYFCWQWGD